MKKILFILIGISTLIASLSIAYYFVIFLPQKDNNYKEELKKIRSEIKNTQTKNNSSEIESKLQDIEYNLQVQERDRRLQTECESNGGVYQGNGTCSFY